MAGPHPQADLSQVPANACRSSPDCDRLYVSDGYSNARIHKYTVDGKLLSSWGERSTDPESRIYVADRENHRVQMFDANGRWETEWRYLHRPNGICLGRGQNPFGYISEIGPLVVEVLEGTDAGKAPRDPPPAQAHSVSARAHTLSRSLSYTGRKPEPEIAVLDALASGRKLIRNLTMTSS